MKQFGDVYRAKRALVPGHIGCKERRLILWFKQLGLEVVGISLTAETQANRWNLFEIKKTPRHYELDIRKAAEVDRMFRGSGQKLIRGKAESIGKCMNPLDHKHEKTGAFCG
jgi:hypothetical protein